MSMSWSTKLFGFKSQAIFISDSQFRVHVLTYLIYICMFKDIMLVCSEEETEIQSFKVKCKHDAIVNIPS